MQAKPPSALQRALSAARLTYPDLGLGASVAAYVEARLDTIAASSDEAERAADVALAGCCVAGDAAAQAHLVKSLAPIVRKAAARLGLSAGDDSEIGQRAQIALLSGSDGNSPALARYTGRGSLRSYLRAVVVRTALKYREREVGACGNSDDETMDLLAAAGDGPEMRLIKERGRGELRVAFEAALAGLTPRQRNLLRQHYLDGLGIDALGQCYTIHRATAARWLERARSELGRGVAHHLRDALGLRPAEVESLVGAVTSQLDLSLSRLLAPRDE